MRNWGRAAVVSLASSIVALAQLGCGPFEQPSAGAVVESCARGEAGETAGLQPGDVVMEWRQGKATGVVESPFHLAMVEQELAPHGPVKLVVWRGRGRHRIAVPHGRWRVSLRPVLSPETLAGHARALESADAGDLEGAAAAWADLAVGALALERPHDSAWFRIQSGVALAKLDRTDECLNALETGARAIEDGRLRAAYWERTGDALLGAGRQPTAAQAFRSGIEILEADSPNSPALAFALVQLCRTNLRTCAPHAMRAEEIYRGIGDEIIEYAQAVTNLAATAYFRSELEAAEEGYGRALEVVRGVASGSPAECELLGNLGLVALRRGDFETAQQIFREEIEIAERLGFDTPQYSHAANYLGLLAKNTGRYEQARLYYERALTAFRQTRPGGIEVAGVLNNLGNVTLLEGNLDAAYRNFDEAMQILQVLDPDSADAAAALHNLGRVARWRGDFDAARELLERALELKEGISPASAWTATTLFELGEVERAEGRFDEAERYHLRGLEMWRRLGPRNSANAMSLFALGAIERAEDRPEAAERLWREAVAIIEERRRGLGMTGEDQTRFGSRYHTYYVELVRLLADQGRVIEAWDLMEKARTGALRAVVSRRDAAPAGVPPDLWFSANRLERQIDRLEGRLARLDPNGNDGPVQQYRTQLASIEAELAAVKDEIARVAPRYASFSTPEAVTFRQLQETLDRGTAVLSYSVGEEGSMALVIAADGSGGFSVQAFSIPMGAEELARRVNIFHALIARGRTVTELEPALTAQGRRLFELLAAPAFEAISSADRVLVIPDGPLADLPFAALLLPGEPVRFLGHFKPLVFNPSAGVYAELNGLRRERSGGRLTIAAFGDPEYPPESAVVGNHRLEPLPGSRTEIEAIGRLFGEEVVMFLGTGATEAAFRANGRGARVLHCAVHAVADPRFPMDSALFFSMVDDGASPADDGVLTAWEIVDSLQTEADVVVLSACSTARGRTVAGEGVVGLARAFETAGASTLVVSQWAIPDRSTAELMTRFYSSLRDGSSTAEALRLAQQRTAESGPGTAHPFHWASFQVRGDWR